MTTIEHTCSNHCFHYKFRVKDPEKEQTYAVKQNSITKAEMAMIQTQTPIGTKTMAFRVTAATTPTQYFVPNLAPILNQLDIGSCVINSCALSVSTQTAKKVNLSRLLMYGLCRLLDGTNLADDVGTTVATACQALQRYGACPETLYPYITHRFNQVPPLYAYQSSKLFRRFSYVFVKQDLLSIKNALTTNKVPLLFAINVYDSFVSDAVAQNGNVPMPNTNTEALLGAHCMTMVGYDETKQAFIVANSWGTSWGNKGFCLMPYAYILNPDLCDDICMIIAVV